MYIWDTKKKGLFSCLLQTFKDDAMSTVSIPHFENNHADVPEPFSDHVRIVIVKSGIGVGGFVSTLMYHD